MPRWGSELTEDTRPPEARLEVSSISYEKGCYLGQEIISRLKSVGQVNRLLCVLSSEERSPLLPGMKLFAPNDLDKEESPRSIGVITSVAKQWDANRWIALGYVRLSAIETHLNAINEETGFVTSVEILQGGSQSKFFY